MGDKEYRLKCLNMQSALMKHKKTPQKEELLNLFATYVYLINPDYKYNETYLKDMIPEFWVNIEKYNLKLEFREKVLKEIQKNQIPKVVKCRFCIQVDDTWELTFDNIFKGNTGEWKRTISNTPKLYSIESNKSYIKCQFSDDIGHAFSDYLVSDDEVKLLKFVTDSVVSFLDRLGV